MMRHISNELARKARYLAERDGYLHEIVNDGPSFHVLCTDMVEISVGLDDNVLHINWRHKSHATILTEGPIGTLVETSPDDVLEAVLEHLRKRTVLEDLSDV